MTRGNRRFWWVVAGGYLLVMAALAASLASARRHVIETLDTPEARAQWEKFLKAERERAEQQDAPVRRRVSTSDEPPHLVLLRDHFAAILGSLALLLTCLYGFLALMLQGVLRGKRAQGAKPGEAVDSS